MAFYLQEKHYNENINEMLTQMVLFPSKRSPTEVNYCMLMLLHAVMPKLMPCLSALSKNGPCVCNQYACAVG